MDSSEYYYGNIRYGGYGGNSGYGSYGGYNGYSYDELPEVKFSWPYSGLLVVYRTDLPDFLALIAGGLLAISAVLLFIVVLFTSDSEKGEGVGSRYLARFLYIHIPMVLFLIFEVVACFLRIESYTERNSFAVGNSVLQRVNGFALRFVALALLEVFLIIDFIYLLLLSKKIKKLRNEAADETTSSRLGRIFTNVVRQFGVILYAQVVVLLLSIFRAVNINVGNIFSSSVLAAVGAVEHWLLFVEALLYVVIVVLLIVSYWFFSPLKAESKIAGLKLQA